MTNYKRFITYLYFYESGKKMGNVGFARVETSDELGKVTIHCSTKVVPSKECKVYLLKRNKSMTISKQVAVATSLNGSLDIKLSFHGGNIDGSEFNLKDTQGVVILYSKDNYIAAKWDDSSVNYHEVILLGQEEEIQQPIPKVEVTQKEKMEEKVSTVQPRIVLVDATEIENLGNVADIKKMEEHIEHRIQTEDRKTEDIKVPEVKQDVNKVTQGSGFENIVVEKQTSVNMGLPIVEDNHVEKKDEYKKSIKDMIRENIKAEKEKENEIVDSEDIMASDQPQGEDLPIDDTELKEEEALHAANCAVPNPNLWADHPFARAILNRFVRMYPFDDGEIAECVRLEPKDIGLLPMSAWVLGNNSFLLHSYCNFRHLLFAKKLTREGCVYLLMVPGSHNNREQQLAKMFGFENFKCSRRRSMRDGEFGYWYVTVVFD